MIEVALKDIHKSYAAYPVLTGVSFELQTGERIAIIGRNGTGKTTIFRLVTGAEPYDRGELTLRKGATTGTMDQIPNYPPNFRVEDVLLRAFGDLLSLRTELREMENQMPHLQGDDLERLMTRYGERHHHFEHMGGYAMAEKLDKICTGLKFDGDFRQKLFSNLSGGEQTRVMLGQILLLNPDILLLDEPTNHLDIDSVEWLESYLQSYPGTVLIISHDRYFLDRTISQIVEIEDGVAEIYHGNFSYFVAEKERRLMAQFEAFKDQQKKIKAMQEAIKRFRDWGQRSDDPRMFKKARNMERRIERMGKVDRPMLERKTMQLGLSSSGRSGRDVVKMTGVHHAFGTQQILHGLDFQVQFGQKVAILGSNGSGKSTLVKLLLGELITDAGEILLGSNVAVGYLPQAVQFEQPEATVLETFREDLTIHEGPARQLLARFLFFADDVFGSHPIACCYLKYYIK